MNTNRGSGIKGRGDKSSQIGVGGMRDYKLKLRDLNASQTLEQTARPFEPFSFTTGTLFFVLISWDGQLYDETNVALTACGIFPKAQR